MDVEWWMDQTNTEITTQIIDTFSEAKIQIKKVLPRRINFLSLRNF